MIVFKEFLSNFFNSVGDFDFCDTNVYKVILVFVVTKGYL